MPTRLDRYVFRQLLVALIAVTGGLAALIWLTQSLRFVELVVNHGLSLSVFLELTGLLIPSFVAVILPITAFVVVQFLYQRLAGDRELTVMRAAGLSPLAIARPALALTVGVVAACYALNLWIVPASVADFRQFQWEIRNRVAAFLLQEGVFTELGDNLTVYVRSRDPDGLLHGILVDDARQPNAHATVFAERGRLLEGPNGPRVELQDGSRQELDSRTGRLNVLTFRENTLDLAQSSHSAEDRERDMTELPMRDLLHPDPAHVAARDIPKFKAEAQKRLATPLTAASFVMIALLSVLTGAFQRNGGLVRPMVAVGTVVLLLALGFGIDNMAARNNALMPLMWVHATLPGLIAGWLLLGQEKARSRFARTVTPLTEPA